MFTALVPIYERTGETGLIYERNPNGTLFHWYRVKFEPRAIVKDLDEAKDRFGRNVVLEYIGKPPGSISQ